MFPFSNTEVSLNIFPKFENFLMNVINGTNVKLLKKKKLKILFV